MAESPKRAALYLGPTTPRQVAGAQARELAYIAQRAGWILPATYADFAISGNTAEFEQMLKDAAQRRFDVLMVWSIDQLGRSLPAAPVPLGNRPRSRDRGRGRTR